MRRTCGAVLVAVVLGGSACEPEEVPEALLFFETESAALAGIWTGLEQITARGNAASQFGYGDEFADGFEFPVALELRADRTFTLRSFGYPVEGSGGGGGFCRGVFSIRGRTLSFFPDGECRALPLNRYTTGRFLPDGLTLRAETGVTSGGIPADEVAQIQVRLRVERD